jgi:hypothetical protein
MNRRGLPSTPDPDALSHFDEAADRRGLRLLFAMIVLFWMIVGVLLVAIPSCAKAAEVRIPERCHQYQRTLTAEAHNVLGIHAPVAVLAAQIHVESGCKSDARSAVGALGLTQFMPATAADMGAHYPNTLGHVDPLSALWAIRAQVRYMRDLIAARERRDGDALPECFAWWLGLKDYNGGSGWTERQRRAVIAAGGDATNIATLDSFRAGRSLPAHAENSRYPRRILITIQPAYVAGGWGRGVDCSEVGA